MAINETNITGAKPKKQQAGFDAEGKPYPGVDPDTFERKALTWAGAIQEFGKPVGPRLYNEVHVAAFGPVRPGKNDLNLMSLEDRWMSPRKDDETDEEFETRKNKFVARRERVQQLIATAEKEAKGGK